ncbi:hypothetical protein B0H34DRAFT_733708 [Crassisporium funariophilum]|nr:hypothetical protein B0H34DRAFT_733708 [Crassisporium funariophilum]
MHRVSSSQMLTSLTIVMGVAVSAAAQDWTPTTVVPPATTPSTTTTASNPGQTHWGQCGGIGWTGFTLCQKPWTCQVTNPYFSHCLDPNGM